MFSWTGGDKGIAMHTVTLEQADKDLKGIMQRAIRDKDEVIIASDEGAVVVLDEVEWSNIKETLRLLSDKRSLAALLECHELRDRGERPEGISPEEAFKDV
jgi:PHD/YefM family antitoxin component YafN of YafNO toxin-antitoxin module